MHVQVRVLSLSGYSELLIQVSIRSGGLAAAAGKFAEWSKALR